ncbi:MAG: hypothetical protein J7M25_17460 [Deltaproteobacteria bacterium]|nr:hypothetical protein [Deltaproteobacteria bacterium]
MKVTGFKLVVLSLSVLWLGGCPNSTKKSGTTPGNGAGGGTQANGGEGDMAEPGIAPKARPTIKLTKKEKTGYDRALKSYERLAAKAQESGWTTGMCEKAAAAFAAVAAGNPRLFAQAKHDEGVIWLHCGKVSRARGLFQSALAKKPHFAASLVSLGYLAAKKGDKVQAHRMFERAFLADPRNSEASFNLGTCYRNKARAGLKLSDVELNRLRALRYASGYPAYASWIAQRENRGRRVTYSDLATRHLQTVLAITSGATDPDSKVLNLRAYVMLALVYTDAADVMLSKLTLARLVVNEADSALKEYKKPLCQGGDRVSPMDRAVGELRNVDGLIRLKGEQLVQAMKQFSAAVRCNPNYLQAHMNIGAIALSFRGYRRAKNSFSVVLHQDSNNVDAIIGLGVAYRGLSAQAMADEKDKLLARAEGQYKLAFRKAQPSSRYYADALYDLGLLYQDYKAGNSDAENKARLRTAMSYYTKFIAHPKANRKARKDAMSRKKDIIRTIDIMKQMADLKRKEAERERQYRQTHPRPAPRKPAPRPR